MNLEVAKAVKELAGSSDGEQKLQLMVNSLNFHQVKECFKLLKAINSNGPLKPRARWKEEEVQFVDFYSTERNYTRGEVWRVFEEIQELIGRSSSSVAQNFYSIQRYKRAFSKKERELRKQLDVVTAENRKFKENAQILDETLKQLRHLIAV